MLRVCSLSVVVSVLTYSSETMVWTEKRGSRKRKRWIDKVKDCLKERGLDVGQARRMGHDGNEWRGAVWGNEPLTLTRYRSSQLP